MIPEDLVTFLHGPRGFVLGTRDARLRPAACWVAGVVADGPNDEITMFIGDSYGRRALVNLRDNGMAALTCGHGPAHETFQFKGQYIESRPTTEQDIAVQELYKSKAVAHFAQAYGEPAGGIFAGIPLHPSTAVRFKVTEIFDQTPGPNAGKPIEFGAVPQGRERP